MKKESTLTGDAAHVKIRKNNHKRAFTLAEILITLGVIGVVAAITLTTVIQNYQKTQTVTRLKKTYSILEQAVILSVADNGQMNTWTIGGNQNADAAIGFFNKYLAPYIKTLKKPEKISNEYLASTYTFLNGQQFDDGKGYARVYLTDGTLLFFRTKCVQGTLSLQTYIDVNGNKKPNSIGKDTFQVQFDLTKNTLFANGIYNTREQLLTNESYMCNKKQQGYRCLGLIIKDGWKISDSYPW